MNPALRPFSFKDDPELLNIAPLETVVQDAGRSSDEGKSKQPDVQIRNLSKISRGKRFKGRAAAGKAGAGILGDQPPGHVQAPAIDVLSQQNLHGQHNVYAASSDSAVRPRESRYHSSNVLGTQSQADHLRRHGNGMSSSEDGVESRECRPRMEHRQISMINRTIKDDMDSLSVSSRETADRPRSMARTVYNKPRRTRVILDD
jgi:mRNA N6-methyladenine demethylase